MNFQDDSSFSEPSTRVPVKPVEGIADVRGWVFSSSNQKALPHCKFNAHAFIAGKRVDRFFRDLESAREFCNAQNARDRQARGDSPAEAEPLLTWRELAARIDYSRDGILSLRQRGMPSVRISRREIRYRWSEVQAWLENGRVQVQPPEQPFSVKPNGPSQPVLKFRVEGKGTDGKRAQSHFRTEPEAISYARKCNSAAGRAALAPLPIYTRIMDPEGPAWNIAQVDSKARPGMRYRVYATFPKEDGDKRNPVKEFYFATEREALHRANRENLKVERERARREAAAAEDARTPAAARREAPAENPADLWTEAQMQGIDTGHAVDPMKGPPFRIQSCTHAIYRFLVHGRFPGSKSKRGERKYFETEGQAKAYAHMRNTQAREQGLESLAFPTWLRVMAERCRHLLAPHGKSIEDATAFFIEHLERTKRSCTVADLSAKLLKSRKGMDVSKGYIQNITRLLKMFGEHIGADFIVSEITVAQIEAFLTSRETWGATTRNNYRAHLGTFFNFGKAHGYCAGNVAEDAPTAREVEKPVGIFTPDELRKLLAATPENKLPYVAIGAFAGLRGAELRRLDWAQIDLEDGYIEVTAKNAKSARRRVVKILPALDAWIRPLAKRSGPVWPFLGFLPTSHLAEEMHAAGIKHWPRNALRHSFASYHLAQFKDAASLALEMGHTTTNLIFQHYRQVVRASAAESFWGIRPPDSAEAGKLVKFDRAAV